MKLSEEEMKKLWKDYSKATVLEKKNEIRNKLVEGYVSLVTYLVNRIVTQLPTGLTKEDLVQFGVCGLIEAIERFNPEQGAKFETYASIRVQGAIKDQIRYYGKSSGGMSRSQMTKSKAVDETIRRLEEKLQRHPSPIEVAKAMDFSLEEYNKMLSEISSGASISLDDMVGMGENLSVVQVIKNENSLIPEEESILTESNELLEKAIEELPEKEKLVVALYYYEDMTLKEIGKVMNLSEGRISQLHTQAMNRLKNKLKGE